VPAWGGIVISLFLRNIAVSMPRGFELRELPLPVVEDIFRSVSFLDKLRCEQTCRDWRDFIHTELAPKTVTMRLVHGMTHADQLKPWVANQKTDSPGFMVPVELTSATHSFVTWFLRQTARLKELIVLLPILGHSQLPCTQLFDHIVAELSLQAGATFHGTSGTPSSTESCRICFLW